MLYLHAKAIIREHNRFNGLRFPVAEFALVTGAALFITFGGYRNNLDWTLICGIGTPNQFADGVRYWRETAPRRTDWQHP